MRLWEDFYLFFSEDLSELKTIDKFLLDSTILSVFSDFSKLFNTENLL